jgi:hypothetical protein
LVSQLFDGHNGSAAAVYAREHLLGNVLRCVPPDLTRDDWLAALPRALVAGFVKTDKDFQTKGNRNYLPYCKYPLGTVLSCHICYSNLPSLRPPVVR